ncbi:MAG: hypothetical protein PHY93_14235 [Bacteriovorax sp.]|nr:hypothetical protein [Bacteriovorax sp.]
MSYNTIMNERDKNVEGIDQKREWVSDYWIRGMSEQYEIKKMPIGVLREVLESSGANFKNLTEEGRKSLQGYSEKERGLGVRQVWGNEFVNEYKEWINKYIGEYEKLHKIELPVLGKKEDKPYPESGRKNSGMIQFLFELTSFASGETTFDNFKKYMEIRINNGVAWAEGRKDDRKKIPVPTSKGKEILIGSIPKEFLCAAIEWIKNRSSEVLPLQ